MTNHAKTAVIIDCEFLAKNGSLKRLWCGPFDPDPVVVQIGAVRLSLEGEFAILDTLRIYVRPFDRYGRSYGVDPFFTELTGITGEQIQNFGISLSEALARLDDFSQGADFWSWGKDEFSMLAISCYVAGLIPPIHATRFGNVRQLVLAAGMPVDDVEKTSSGGLAAYFGLTMDLRAHDALEDAVSVSNALQHLLRDGRLQANTFELRSSDVPLAAAS